MSGRSSSHSLPL